MTLRYRPRPSPLPWFHRWCTNLLQTPGFALTTILCGTLSLITSLWDKGGSQQHAIAQTWARISLAISGSHTQILGKQNLGKFPVAVYISNHTSYMDTPVIFASLPFQFRILAKSGLWKVPFIGWHLNRSGQLPIDISNPRATIASLGNAVRALKSGMSVFVFPEGGRTEDGTLKPFLSGAAFLAIRAGVPIVPMALHGVRDLLPMGSHHYYPNLLTLSVGEPISTAGLSIREADHLTERVRQQVLCLYDAIQH